MTLDHVIKMLARILALAVAFPFHESAHGLAALALGDRSAKDAGRISMNPLKHFDMFGFVLLLLIGFGWGKPVPINPYNFKHKKSGIAITAAAGPLANLLLAYISVIVFKIFYVKFPELQFIQTFLFYSIGINICLMLFNLIPIPPLDGSRILYYFMDDESYGMLFRYSTILFIVMLVGIHFLEKAGIYGAIVQAVFSVLDDASIYVDHILFRS